MEATLIWADKTKDPDGFLIENNHSVKIYVEEKSAVRTEFYEAMRAGIDVKLILETRQEDYELSEHLDESGNKGYARKVEYQGYIYDIIRAYKAGKAKIQMTCG